MNALGAELLVSFFTQTLPLLSPTPGASIIVTLFEGEPYTLWNIRDLARHSGLEVARSFRFQAAAYEGYKHARTLGAVKGRDGNLGSGWKGEDRSSRTYEFVRKGEGVQQGPGKNNESSDDEDDQDEGIEDHDPEDMREEEDMDEDSMASDSGVGGNDD
jgi:25S rRNA (uracil2634-N3)-methyltransferase